jgi:serine/threonine protein kinase
MEQVLSAVGYAHRQGVIHRDLKPSNVMVMGSGETKVTDFGIAKVLGSTKLTRTGTAMGSPHYMSPEQIRRPESVDSRSDIYSLGCVFYEMLSDRPPFGDVDDSGTESDFDIKEGHIRGQATDLGILKPGLPQWLTQLVMQLLEKEPEHRPASCEVILDRLHQGSSTKNGTSFPQYETRTSADNQEQSNSAPHHGAQDSVNTSRDYHQQAGENSQSDSQSESQKPKKGSNYTIIVIIAVVASRAMHEMLNFNWKEILILNGCLLVGYLIIANLLKNK